MLGIGIGIGRRAFIHHHSMNEAVSYALTPAHLTRVAMWNSPGRHGIWNRVMEKLGIHALLDICNIEVIRV